MNIIGISSFYHDSAVCLLIDGKVINAIQEERFSRIKNDMSFPINALDFCLKNNGLGIEDIDLFVFYEKPFVKFERILENVLINAPKGLKSFVKQIPVWMKEKIFLKDIIYNYLKNGKDDKALFNKIAFVPHHFAHAGSAFYPSNFDESAIITIDGVGEWATASIGHGRENKIRVFKEMYFPHSIGLFYSSVTYYLGFKVNSDEYKVMGLAPYGNERSKDYEAIYDKFKQIIKINDDGSVFLKQNFFDYLYEDRMVKDLKWKELFGFERRKKDEKIEQWHCDMALASQRILESAILKMCKLAKEITRSKNLCLAGGVALNCVANSRILEENIFDNIWIQPAAGDAGGAMGAAFCGYHIYFDKQREIIKEDYDKLNWSFLGPEFSNLQIIPVLKKYKLSYLHFEDFEKLVDEAVKELLKGKVIGWFQGRMEWGPRALGNRSILADPRNKEMQRIVNLKVKFREGFRPFAPAVLEEDFREVFEERTGSPYMLLVSKIKEGLRKYCHSIDNMSVEDKINYSSSVFPAVTHLDFSARAQIVNERTNYKFYRLLKKFKENTGFGIILNTSFNVKDEPIVCSPEDAIKCYLKTDIDLLFIEDFIVYKKR